MPSKRFLFIPIGAIAITVLSYGVGAINGQAVPPSGPVAATVQDPATQPGVAR